MRKNEYLEEFPSTSRRRDKEKVPIAKLSHARPSTASGSTSGRNERIILKPGKHVRHAKPVEATTSEQKDVSKLSQDLSRIIFQTTTSPTFVIKRGVGQESHPRQSGRSGGQGASSVAGKPAAMNEAQTLQIKKILAECLTNFESDDSLSSNRRTSAQDPTRKSGQYFRVAEGSLPFAPVSTFDSFGKTSLLRSYLSGSNPAREEYISKRKNVPNSLISSDSVHHSIFLESGRERRQCLLQYLNNVAPRGQVVIYANSIPGVESLKHFLSKHGFHVNAVHQRMLMAESNWILSEFSLKKFGVLLCAEDHYHSYPAHFRWVTSIINYELPICNPLENWAIRNGIVEFSDNLPVHIYTFIKKTCPLDIELVKLLKLDFVDHEEENMMAPNEQVYSLK